MQAWRIPVATWLACLLGVALGISPSLKAQTVSILNIKTASVAGVSLVPYNPAAQQAFTGYFENSLLARLSPFAAVLKNSSMKTIVALTLRWTWNDTSGREHVLNYATDSLFLSRRPVAVGGATLLVTPDFLLPESMVRSGIIRPGDHKIERDVSVLEQSSNVTVALDMIVFDDGQAFGLDQSDTLAKIQARREAAARLSSHVLTMLQHGEDPSPMLSEAAKRAYNSSDSEGVWTARIAGLFQHSPETRRLAGQLAALPTITFHLNTNEGEPVNPQ